MKPWRVILAAVVIFAAGVVSGVLGAHLQRAKSHTAAPAAKAGGPPPWLAQRRDLLGRMHRQLELTDPQRVELDRLFEESQQRMRELWKTISPKAEEEMKRVRERMDAILTAEQRQKYEELRRQRPPGEGESRRREGHRDGPGTHPGAPERPPAPPGSEGTAPTGPPPSSSPPGPTAPPPH